MHMYAYGGFQKWGYPKIIRFNRMYHHKPSIGVPPPFLETSVFVHIYCNIIHIYTYIYTYIYIYYILYVY